MKNRLIFGLSIATAVYGLPYIFIAVLMLDASWFVTAHPFARIMFTSLTTFLVFQLAFFTDGFDWDDRGNWFANDGIDYCTGRLVAAVPHHETDK